MVTKAFFFLSASWLLFFSAIAIGNEGERLGDAIPQLLRTEYLVDPQGVDVQQPRLSWILAPSERGTQQTGYQVLVASSREKLAAHQGDLWDSGRVESSETIAITYEGKPLQSGDLCFWKVRLWDKNLQVGKWSEPSHWSMGLLNPSDWKAKWIGHDLPIQSWLEQEKPTDSEEVEAKDQPLFLPPPRYLRTKFSLAKPVRRAMLYGSALGLHEISLNGKRVGDDYFAPGWTDYDKRAYYQTYDVTKLLNQGENAWGAILADGWYAGYIGWYGERDLYGSRTRLLAQLEIEYEDGSHETFATGPHWKASTGPLLEADFLMGESYDARLQTKDWNQTSFDDSSWHPVEVTNSIPAVVQAHPGVSVQEMSSLAPVEINELEPGKWIVDLGQNFAGVVRLRVRGEEGQRIQLRHGESLEPDGKLHTANLRTARATDSYICRGDEDAQGTWWQPRFTFHGFRYVEITGYPGQLTKNDSVGVPLSSATPVVGHFECSDPMVNQLFSNIRWTQRMNFIDVPTDCPQRDERLGWTGDAQVYIRTASLLTDVHAFFTKWLVDLDDAQRSDGQYPMVAPLISRGVSKDGGPAWADAGVICPWTIYQVYGDERLLEQHYGNMARFIEFCKNRCDAKRLPPKEFHTFGDWLNIDDDTPKPVIFTAYFAQSTRLMARAATALGKAEEAKEYEALYEEIKAAFNEAYVLPSGRIEGDTQTTYVLALAFDLVDGTRKKESAKRLVDLIEQRDFHLSTGFVGTKDLMPVLTKIGRNDIAYRLLLNKTFPSWGFSIANDATTIWERWNGWTPAGGYFDSNMNSLAHYSFGAVAQWMFEVIGGIQTDGPSYKQIVISPQPGGNLTWANVSYRSIRGTIVSRWKIEGDKFFLHVEVPPNTSAVVRLPTRFIQNITKDGKPVKEARDAYSIDSGSYVFTAEL